MLKLVLSLLLIVSASLIGNSFSQRLVIRCRTLSALVGAINRIKTLICFGGMDIAKVMEMSLCTPEFPLIDYESLDSELPYDKAFEYCVKNISKEFALTEADKKLLTEFGSKLGDTDVSGQIAHTELYAQLFRERLTELKEQEISKTKLYRVLGFSFGCAISLLIV